MLGSVPPKKRNCTAGWHPEREGQPCPGLSAVAAYYPGRTSSRTPARSLTLNICPGYIGLVLRDDVFWTTNARCATEGS
jgi:hypothetical protein